MPRSIQNRSTRQTMLVEKFLQPFPEEKRNRQNVYKEPLFLHPILEMDHRIYKNANLTSYQFVLSVFFNLILISFFAELLFIDLVIR